MLVLYTMVNPEELELVQTCGAYPEQYDVYYESCEVGYLRLRHETFRAECFNEVVYTAYPNGDGILEDEEREYHLGLAKNFIAAKMNLIESLDKYRA
jgi:hypothetical protein